MYTVLYNVQIGLYIGTSVLPLSLGSTKARRERQGRQEEAEQCVIHSTLLSQDLAIKHFVWKGGVAEEKFQFCGNRTLFQWALNFLLKRLNRFKNRGKEAQLSLINFPLSWQFSKSPKVKLAQLSYFLMFLFSFLNFSDFPISSSFQLHLKRNELQKSKSVSPQP